MLVTTILEKFLEAVGYLFMAGIIIMIYHLAKEYISFDGYDSAKWKLILACFVIALFASFALGKPSCEEVDPISGSCEITADDSFDPTTDQRVARFTFLFTFLLVPVAIAVFDGRNDARH